MRRWSGNKSNVRRGAAIVETAVVAPLVLTMMFGVIEFGWVFMIQQSMTNAVREACRVAVLPGAVDADVKNRFVTAMEGTGLSVDANMVTIDPATTGDPVVTVHASLPYSQVSLLGGSFPFWSFSGESQGSRNSTLGAVCSMRKEGL